MLRLPAKMKATHNKCRQLWSGDRAVVNDNHGTADETAQADLEVAASPDTYKYLEDTFYCANQS